MRNLLFYIKSLAMVLLLCCSTLGLQAQKTIVIGPSAKADHDFSKFDSLLTEVSAGNLSGQLVFAFESGTYTFTKALKVNTAKFTPNDHLTITSVAGDHSAVTFSYSTGTAITGLVTLNNTCHVTFSHLTLHNSSTANGTTVSLNGPIEDVTFYHCYLKRTDGTAFSTNGLHNVIGCTASGATTAVDNNNGNNGLDTTVKWLRFIGNTIDNGCRNIITMATTHRMQGLVFNDNTIFDNTGAGIMIYRADSVTCNRNHVMVKDNSTSYWSPGIQLSAITGDSVCGNFISFLNQHATANTWGGTAISVGGASALTSGTGANKRMIIANNVILGYNNTSYASSNVGSCSLLSLSNIVADVFFNSIYNERTSAVPSNANQNRTVYVLNIGGTSDLNLIGNQFIAYDDKNQHVARVDTSTLLRGKIVSEYNNLYFINGGTNYAYDYAQKAYTLTDLQKLFGDSTSVSIDPKFADASQNLELSDYAKFLIVPNPGVSTDYQGLSRGKISTVGAYTAADVDAALVDFAKTDFSVNVSGVNDLYVTLKNNGLDTLTSATILWSDAAGSIQKFPWKGSLAPGATDVVNVGQFKPVAGTFYAVRAWVTDPNNVQDGFHGNDTIYTKQYVCKGVLAGDYTIGKGYDFATLEDALTALHACGINASVRLLMTAGTYGTTTISGTITGADSKNTITLMPYKNDVVVFDGGSADASLIVENTAHWIFEGLTIGNTTDGLRGVDLIGTTENILFHGCNIYASTSATANTYRGVNLASTSATTTHPENVRFIGNHIQGGYDNFYLYYMCGNNTANIAKTAMVIDSNILSDAYRAGIYASYSGFESVSHNTITNRSVTTTYYGIYGTNYCIWNHVEGNRVHINTTSTSYGIYFTSYQQPATYAKQPAYACNNEIRMTGTGARYGLEVLNPYGNWEVHHNTIYIQGSTSTTYGFQHSNANNSYKVNFTHNMVYCSYTSSYPLYMTAANAVAARGVRAYNNLYAPTNIAYIGAAKKTVADLMTASTNNDTNTTNVLPVFNNPKGDLTLSNMMTFVCPTDPNLPAEDINGTPRGKVTLLGAYTAVSADAALLDFAKTSHYATSGAIDLYVTLQNSGLDTLENVTIFWNDGTEQKFPWKGSLAPGATEVVNVGQFKAVGDKMYQLTAWVSDPNNTKDGYNGNDTIRTSHYSCSNPYAGDYIVGPRGTFATMEEAIARLQDCGIDKPVRLLVMGGTYGTLTISGTIPGADSKNTITLMPFRDDVVIFDGGSADASLIVENTAHWIFEGLTIGNTTDGLRGVDLLGHNEDILFHGCNIFANKTTTSSSYRCVNLPNASGSPVTDYPVDVRFVGNTIQGGYYNFYLSYMAINGTNIANTSMYIDSNILSDAYNSGAYVNYYAHINSFSHNTITNRTNATSTYYGVYASYYGIWDRIEGNRIRINNTSTAAGFYLLNYQQYASYAKQPANLCNNEITITGTGTRYGIYITSPNGNWEVHHNTVYIEGNSTIYGLYHTNASNSYKVNMTRNMVFCTGGTNYPLYLTAANAVAARGKREYNNLYSPTNVAYIGAAKTSVADLMTASTNNDSNTLKVLPVFKDINVNLRVSNDADFLCPTDASLLADITGAKRDTVTAMGAYDLAPITVDATLKGFVGLDKVTSSPAQVAVVISNEGESDLKEATITLYINGKLQSPAYTYRPKTPLAKGMLDTVVINSINVVSGTHIFKAIIEAKNEIDPTNDTLTDAIVFCLKQHGTFVVGNSPKADLSFDDINTFWKELGNCGVDGDITLEIESGDYTMASAWNFNTSIMSGYHLTVTSQAKNQDSVVISYGGAIAAIQLNNTSDVTFSHLTISSTKTDGLHAVGINGPVENVLFYRCHIMVPATATKGSCCPVGTASASAATDKGSISATVNRLHFVGNTIDGGCRNFWLNGTAANHLTNIRIDSNIFLNSYDQDVNLNYCDTLSFCANTDIPRPGINANHQGVTIANSVVDSICGNLINYNATTVATHTGVLLNISASTPASGKRFLIANNVIIGKVAVGYSNSIGNVVTLSNVLADFMHNSIYNNRATTNATYSVNCLNLTGASSDIQAIGNQLVTIDTNEFPLRIDATITTYVTDYNNYWNNGGNVARDGSASYATLKDLQKLTGNDQNSLSTAPAFSDITNGLQLNDYAAFLVVPNLGVNTDIRGITRAKVSAIGAYTPADMDAALLDFGKTSVVVNPNGVPNDLYVTLYNAGLNTLTSATIYWNDGTQQKFPWNGKLAPGDSEVVLIGQFKATVGSYYAVKAWVADPNSTTDGFAGNDTIYMNQYMCKEVLAGDYVIGKGQDFATLDDAIFTLAHCGVSAPVRLMLTAGTYGSTTFSGTFPGTDSKNTITLMPFKDDVVIFNGGNTASSLIVDSLAHWVFQGLTIGNTKDGLTGVELKNGNEDVTFRDCDIYANKTTKVKPTTNASCISAVKLISANNATVYPVNVRFIGNRIVGGSVNFQLVYAGGSQAQMPYASIIIDSNIMSDAFCASIHNSSWSVVKSICYNTITNRADADTMFTAIHGNTNGIWEKIIGNRIHLTTNFTASGSSVALYGMVFLNGANTSTTNPCYICNNEIHLASTGTASKSIYAIRIYTTANWEVHHNTIYTYANAGTSYGISSEASSNDNYKLNATRNLVFCDNAGTRYPLYVNSAANAARIRGLREYNNFYSATNVAYIGGAKTTVAAVQSASKDNDSNTISVMPAFTDMTVDLSLSNALSFLCPTDPNLPATDINGTTRAKSTAMGAYTVASLDAALEDFGKTSHFANQSGDIDLYVTLRNAGLDTLESATIYWNDGTIQKYAWKGKLASGDDEAVLLGQFKATGGNSYQIAAWVSDPNNGKDGFSGNDTIRTSHYVCAGPFAGDYTVGPKGDFASLDEAITHMNECGISKPVRLQIMGGTYASLTISGSILGADSKNTVTLMPFKDDIVIYDGGSANASLIVDNAAHWVFQGLTIGNTTDGLRGVDLIGQNEDITFRGCNIYANETATGSTYRCVNLPNTSSSTTFPMDVRFVGNLIQGGYYNFYLYYTAGSDYNAMDKASIFIDSNILKDAYNYGVYSGYRSAVKSLCYNTISSRSNLTTAYYGIYGLQYGIWDRIMGNRILITTTNTAYGIQMASYQQDIRYTKQPAYLCNNEIQLLGNGNKYGICITTPNGNWEVHHNSIYIHADGTGTLYGFQHTNTADTCMVNFSRNMVYCTGGANNYPLYLTAANAVDKRGVREYNNFYSPTNVAYIGKAMATVNDLQTASGQDSNTISVLPVFNDTAVDLSMANDTSFRCPTDKPVLEDINGTSRGTVTAMGAHHFIVPAINAGLKGFVGLDKVTPETASPIAVIIANEGNTDITEAILTLSINGNNENPFTYQPKTPLAKGMTDTVVIANVSLKAGTYKLQAVIDTKGDADPKNDTIADKLNVTAPVINAGLKGFVGLDKVTPETASPIAVIITNEGDVDIKEATLTLSINGNNENPFTYQPKSPLAKGMTDTVVIAKVSLKAGAYKLQAVIDTKGDIDPKNDTIADILSISAPVLNAALKGFIGLDKVTSGTASPIYVIVSNEGDAEISTASISLYLDGNIQKPAYTYQPKSPLAKGKQDTVLVNSLTVKAGTYKIKAIISATGDADPKNDTIEDKFNVAKVFDLAVTALMHPDSMDLVGQPVQVAVRITNNGTQTVTSATIYYLFNAGSTGSAKIPNFTWTGSLAPGQSVVATSATTQTVTLKQGLNTMKVFINERDEDVHNDTLDVNINANNLPLDATLTEFIGLENINPATSEAVKVVISNNNLKPIESAVITLYINGVAQKPAYTYQPRTPLAPKASDTVELGKYSCNAGSTTFMAVIAAKNDIDPKNDTLKKNITVEAYDLKLDAIVSPQEVTGPVCYSSSVPIILTITNNSKRDVDFSAAALKISVNVSGAATMNADTAISKGTLAAGKSMNVQLKNLPTLAEGEYNVAAEFGYAYDNDITNNVLKTVYRVYHIGIPYDVDFSAMPKELVTYTEKGNANWQLGNSGNPVPTFGNGCLKFTGESNTSSVANVTLNGVDIQGFTAPKLSFWYAQAAIAKGDSLIVKATTDGGQTYTVLGRIATLDTAYYWKQYDYDLSGFAKESCLSIVFQAISGGINQYIDRIRISARQDAAITMLPLQIGTRTACSSDPVEVKAVVTNLTTLDLPLVNDTITMNVSGAIQTSNIYVYNKTLKGMESDTVTVGKFVPNASGFYYLEIAMQSMDDDASNDVTRDSSLYLMQDLRINSVSGIDEQVVKNAGDTVTVTANVANNGNTVIGKLYVQMKLNGTEVITDTVNTALGINDTLAHTISVPYIVPFATKANPTYTLEVSAFFDCDADNTNNALKLTGKVNVPDTVDLYMVAISTTDPAQGKTELKPTVSVGNTGNTDATNVKVHVTVYDNNMTVLTTLEETVANLPMNDTVDVAFTQSYTVPNYTGTYTMVACIEAYTNDADNSNDTLSASFACTKDSTGIRNHNAISWTMGQNIPNPAAYVTRIPYTLPQEGNVTFHVMSMSGQVLYRQEFRSEAGQNSIELNTSDWADGIYYYSMEYQGQRIVRKMSVNR